MEIDDVKVDQIAARLRRVEGQVRGLQGMIESGRDCADVIVQFSAAVRALEQAGFQYFAATLAQCAADPARAADQGYTAEKLEKMFLQLA